MSFNTILKIFLRKLNYDVFLGAKSSQNVKKRDFQLWRLFSQNILKFLFLKHDWTELFKNLHGGRYSDSPKTNREFF